MSAGTVVTPDISLCGLSDGHHLFVIHPCLPSFLISLLSACFSRSLLLTFFPTLTLSFLFQASIPFAVIGSNQLIEVKGKKIRGRLYPWGVVEVENPEHNDFLKLRTMLV